MGISFPHPLIQSTWKTLPALSSVCSRIWPLCQTPSCHPVPALPGLPPLSWVPYVPITTASPHSRWQDPIFQVSPLLKTAPRLWCHPEGKPSPPFPPLTLAPPTLCGLLLLLLPQDLCNGCSLFLEGASLRYIKVCFLTSFEVLLRCHLLCLNPPPLPFWLRQLPGISSLNCAYVAPSRCIVRAAGRSWGRLLLCACCFVHGPVPDT